MPNYLINHRFEPVNIMHSMIGVYIKIEKKLL